MGHVVMLVIVLSTLLPTMARADTVYLNDGQSIWGRSAWEEGGLVVVNRPTGEVRLPRGAVNRIEPVRNTLPPHYSPPGVAPAPAVGEAPARAATLPPPVATPAATEAPPATPPGEPTALPPPPGPPQQ